MIAYIEGRIIELLESGCVVLTDSGVGYEVSLTAASLERLPGTGERVAFHVATVVREDAFELYGFSSADERAVFRILTTISKVGARTAMAVLSIFRPEELRRLVAEDDYLPLTRVTGIGKKSAQHIFLELKYKLEGRGAASSAVLASPGGAGRDAVGALLNLGYDEDEAARAVRAVLENRAGAGVAEIVRLALRQLGGSR